MKIRRKGIFSNETRFGHPVFFTLLYMKKGSGRLRMRDRICQVCEGEIFLLLPNEFGEKIGDWSKNTGGFFQGESSEIIHAEDGFLYPDAKGKKQLAEILEGEKGEAGNLFTHLKTSCRRDEKPLAEKISAYVRANISASLSAETVAEEIGSTVRKLGVACKEAFGVGFAAYVSRVRLDRAKHLLKNKNLSVSEIAKRLGFSSSAYFSGAFKKETGLSPSDYRKYMQ